MGAVAIFLTSRLPFLRFLRNKQRSRRPIVAAAVDFLPAIRAPNDPNVRGHGMWLTVLRLSVLTASVSIFATGCHREHPRFSVGSDVSASAEPLTMRVVDASERGRRIRVRAWFVNHGDHDVLVDRNSLGLRLADGRVLPVSSIRRHRPYVFEPGRGRVLKVDFRVDGDVGDVSQASLTMGGAENTPPLHHPETTCTTVPPGAVIVIGGTPGVIPSAPPTPAAKSPRVNPSPAPADDDDTDDQEDPPAGESWEIGGARGR